MSDAEEKGQDFDQVPVTAAQGDKPIDRDAANRAVWQPHPNPRPEQETNDFKSPAFYTGLTRWHPFIGYFQFISDCSFPDKDPDVRFNNCIERHPKFYKFSYVADIFVMIVTILAMLAAAGLLVYKAFF